MGISITGLSSGLDTAAMIKALMDVEKLPYTRLETKKTNLTSEQNVFRNINTKLSTLNTAISDLLLPSNFNLVSSKSSNESAAKITTTSSASTGEFNVEVKDVAQSHSIKSGEISTAGNTLEGKILQIGDIEITVPSGTEFKNDGDALEYIKNQINGKNTGLSAAIISVDDKKVLMLTSKATGTDNKMTVGTPTGNQIKLSGDALTGLGISTTDLSSNETQEAKNAQIILNGVTINSSSNQIKDTISGATIEVIAEGTTKLSVSVDADQIAAKVDAFVKAYNDVINSVRNNLAKPADDTKMNPLQGDSVLKDVSNQLYSIFNSLTGTKAGANMMSQIGLEIDKGITKGSLMTGTITFDKEKFKQMLTEDPQAVKNMFAYRTTDEDAAQNEAPGATNIIRDGIMVKLNEQLKTWTNSVNGLFTSKIKGYDSEISMLDDRMVQLDERLVMKEAALKKKFSNMEVMLSSLNNQKSWMTSQLASLTAAASSSK